jgi:hypothetical protein
MAPQRLDEAKITTALKWACDKETLIENDYDNSYPALLAFFNKLDLQSEPNVIGAAHAVYGRMPTILKKEVKAEDLVKFVRDLKRIDGGTNRKTRTLGLLKNHIEITQAINGSTVGTSKFLHFVAPEVFPIWDSNIARAFDAISKINDPATYLAYCEAVHQYLGENPNSTWPNKIPDGISSIRKIEFCLYAYGKHLKSRP